MNENFTPRTTYSGLDAALSRIPEQIQKGLKPFAEQKADAFDYLRSKFPEAEPSELYSTIGDVLKVKRDEELCASCRGDEKCEVKNAPLVLSSEYFHGKRVYVVRAGKCGSAVAIERQKNLDAAARINGSGLTEKQKKQTFESFNSKGLSRDIRKAESEAIRAATKGEWLVLAGKRGTGKSHLAAAIALYRMNLGLSALFRSAPEMFDELREAHGFNNYPAKIKALKDVDCLVIDDFGKEHHTENSLDNLFQVLDFRYRNEKQTIITTNAETPDELASWGSAKVLVPIISRVNEMGYWCSIASGSDYRSSSKTLKMETAA